MENKRKSQSVSIHVHSISKKKLSSPEHGSSATEWTLSEIQKGTCQLEKFWTGPLKCIIKEFKYIRHQDSTQFKKNSTTSHKLQVRCHALFGRNGSGCEMNPFPMAGNMFLDALRKGAKFPL